MKEIDILKWAAGASIDLPRFDDLDDDRILYLFGIDEEKLVYLLPRHRLTTRFLHRFQQERPGWCSRPLLARVLEYDTDAQQRTREQMAAMQEITQSLASQSRPPIVIKGYSTYALTGEPRCLRRSRDLDVFAHDLEALQAAMQRLGYTTQPSAARYEYMKMTRGNVVIEIHSYRRVWSYPAGVAADNLVPARRSGCWIQPFACPTRTKILYDDLRERATTGVTPETQGLTVPCPAMAVLVLCTHEFGEYFLFLSRQRGIKLGLIADIYDLVRHPQFDRQYFARLVEKFRAQDSVAFVAYLLKSFYKSEALAGFAPRLRARKDFPQVFEPLGCWASLSSPDDLLVPPEMKSVISKLEANSVTLCPGGKPALYSFFMPGQQKPAGRVLLRSAGGERLPLQIRLQMRENSLDFGISILKPLQGTQSYRVNVLIYDREMFRYEAIVSERSVRVSLGEPSRASLSVLDQGVNLTISLPLQDLPEPLHRGVSLPVVVSVQKWNEDIDLPSPFAASAVAVPFAVSVGG